MDDVAEEFGLEVAGVLAVEVLALDCSLEEAKRGVGDCAHRGLEDAFAVGREVYKAFMGAGGFLFPDDFSQSVPSE